jgi:DNA-binding NtrC family response regulator
MPKRILLIEDDRLSRETLAQLLMAEGHKVVAVASAEDAIAFLPGCDPELALVDVRLPGMRGDEFALILRRKCPYTRVLFISGDLRVEAMDRFGPDARFFPKPLDLDQLLQVIN